MFSLTFFSVTVEYSVFDFRFLTFAFSAAGLAGLAAADWLLVGAAAADK